MQAFTTLVILASALVSASPNPVIESTINLDNGAGVSAATLHDRNFNPLVARKDSYPNCKGSSLCSTAQAFKNDCSNANAAVQPTTYKSGGSKAGTCHGHCGLFVQGKKDGKGNTCAASGADLTGAYQALLANGCQTCGSVVAPAGGDCIITVNYVGSC